MKKILLCFTIVACSLLLASCQSSYERAPKIEIEGSWRGDIPSEYPTSQYGKLFIDFNNGVAKVSSSASPTSGWYDGEGTYKKEGDKILFDIKLKTPDFMASIAESYPKYKITHADNITKSGMGNTPIFKLHFNKTVNGETSSNWMWMTKY